MSQRKNAADRWWEMGILFVLVSATMWVLLDSGDYGITYDEAFHVQHGANIAAWYASGFEDRSFERLMDLKLYGGLFDLAAHGLCELTSGDPYRVRHLLTGLLAVFGMLAVALLGRQLAGPAAGFFGVLLLATTPRWVGHACVNPKDIPFAVFHAWSLLAGVSFVRSLPRPGWRQSFALGGAMGLMLGIRIGGLLLLMELGAVLFAWWLCSHRKSPSNRSWVLGGVRVLVPFLGAGAIAYAVMFPFWPYFHLNPIMHPLNALRGHAHGSVGTFSVFFNGATMPNDQVPSSYVWVYLAHVLPETILLGLGLALWLCLRSGAGDRRAVWSWTLVLVASMLPLGVVTVLRPVIYDGVRHFLFVVATLAMIAGTGIAALLNLRRTSLRLGGLLAVVLSLALAVSDVISLHPYEMVHFNRAIAGGVFRAQSRFETDYWGLSFKEGAEWLNEHRRSTTRLRVASSCFPTQTAHFLQPRFEYVGSVDHTLEQRPYHDPPDLYLATTRWDRHRVYPGRVIHRVERQGVTLLVVVEVDRTAAKKLRR